MRMCDGMPLLLGTHAGRDGSGVDKDRSAPPGGGNYRVLLLDDPGHTEKVGPVADGHDTCITACGMWIVRQRQVASAGPGHALSPLR
jgi:hypothetical protein